MRINVSRETSSEKSCRRCPESAEGAAGYRRLRIFPRCGKVRRGSVSIETVTVIPVAVTLLLLGRFILEAGLTRHELAVYTRTATANAADATSTSFFHCEADRDPFTSRETVTQTASVECSQPNGEKGLSREQPFMRAMKKGARPFPKITRDVERNNETRDMRGNGDGSMTFDRPDFLARQGTVSPTAVYQIPQDELWSAADQPWTKAHDPVLWQELRRRGTHRLVPNLFPRH